MSSIGEIKKKKGNESEGFHTGLGLEYVSPKTTCFLIVGPMYRKLIIPLAAFLLGLNSISLGQERKPHPSEKCGLGLHLGGTSTEGTERQIDAANMNGGLSAANPNEEVIRIDTDLVITEFNVRDRRGRRVSGLSPADFIVKEDGVPQKIEVFSSSGASSVVGRSVILIIDYSNSQTPYLATSIAAAKTLISMLEPNDRMAIVSDDVELLVNFTSDKAELERQLNNLQERSDNGDYGASRQFTAIYRAIGELFARDEKRPVVIFQTDGDEFPLIGQPVRTDLSKCSSDFDRLVALERLIERSGTTVHSIIPGTRYDVLKEIGNSSDVAAAVETEIRSNPIFIRSNAGRPQAKLTPRFMNAWMRARLRDAAAVKRIAKVSGGTANYLERPDQAEEVYRRILNEMNERYLVGYYPASPLRTGNRRSVRVTLRPGLDHKIFGRDAEGRLRKMGEQ